MKLLLPPAGGYFVVDTMGSYAELWRKITFSWLLQFEIMCGPFRINGRWWAVALKGDPQVRKWPDPVDRLVDFMDQRRTCIENEHGS